MSGMRRPSLAGEGRPALEGADADAVFCLGCSVGPSAMISAFFGKAHDARQMKTRRMKGFFTEAGFNVIRWEEPG